MRATINVTVNVHKYYRRAKILLGFKLTPRRYIKDVSRQSFSPSQPAVYRKKAHSSVCSVGCSRGGIMRRSSAFHNTPKFTETTSRSSRLQRAGASRRWAVKAGRGCRLPQARSSDGPRSMLLHGGDTNFTQDAEDRNAGSLVIQTPKQTSGWKGVYKQTTN